MSERYFERYKEQFLNIIPDGITGYFTIFDLADSKQRNAFLGYTEVNKDITEFDSILINSLLSSGISQRIAGDKWAVFVSSGHFYLFDSIIQAYQQQTKVKAGWLCKAKFMNGQDFEDKVWVTTTLWRAVRCGYFYVESSAEIISIWSNAFEKIWAVPVNVPTNLVDFAIQQGPKWHCLDLSKLPSRPGCPVCHSQELEWIDAFGVFQGAATCSNCSAELEFVELLEEI